MERRLGVAHQLLPGRSSSRRAEARHPPQKPLDGGLNFLRPVGSSVGGPTVCRGVFSFTHSRRNLFHAVALPVRPPTPKI